MSKAGLRRTFNDKTIICVSAAANIAVMLLCALVFIPQAINNDDLIIHSITAGAYGESSAGLVHTNILMGYALVFLQKMVRVINWFELTEYALIFTGSVLMTCMVWLRNPDLRGFFTAFSFCLFVSPYFYNELHNTKSVPFVAAAALLAVLFGVLRKQNAWCVIGGIAALLASMIRFQAFLMGAAFAFGACLFHLIRELKDPERRRTAGRMVLIFAVVFAVIFGCYTADLAICAKDPQITYYREYNAARGAVSDYELPAYDENARAYDALGISENDYETIVSWNFSDPEVFDADLLYRVAALRDPVSPAEAASKLVSDLSGYAVSISLILPGAALFLLCLIFTDRSEKLSCIWMILVFFALFYYLCLGGRTTRWVIAGLAGAAVCGLLFCMKLPETDRARNLRFAVITAAVILTACAAYDAVSLGPEISTYSESFSVGAFKPKKKLNKRGILYIADIGNSISLQTATPVFSSVPEGIYQNIYFLGGWDSGSPAKNSILERFGYSAGTSPYRILAEEPQVYLLDNYRPQQKITFIREHYYPNASLALYEAMSGQLIYSACVEEFPAAEPAFSITDASLDFSEEYEGYYFVGASTDIEIGADDLAYYELTDNAGSVRTYQARPIESAAGTGSLVLWIPEWDLPHGISGLKLRVIIRSGGTVSSSDTATLF